ncbi:MAG: Mrp/NBP35 family ATP-binding protein [Gammaproteobacteria bacterium]|jgi:ATP-binding protein involved in chromosome partitioning
MAEQAADTITLPQVGRIIAVGSGKGGVGKSTVACNLAAALQAQGASVGLLDADIYGPSVGRLLGVAPETRPEVADGQLMPVVARGLVTMSMSYLGSERTPAIWRGPMASGALQQMLTQTKWPPLDVLIIDMPPGTGDIQLTLAQRVRLDGAVIVTTPQDLSLLDARKGIEMFRKVEVPILGIVENMSTHVCTQCGHEEPLFGEQGGQMIAEEYGVSLLAELPLEIGVRVSSDQGIPLVQIETSAALGAHYHALASAVQTAMSAQGDATEFPTIEIVDD